MIDINYNLHDESDEFIHGGWSCCNVAVIFPEDFESVEELLKTDNHEVLHCVFNILKIPMNYDHQEKAIRAVNSDLK